MKWQDNECQVDEMACCRVQEKTSRENDKLMKWLVDEMVSWQNGWIWWNGKLMKCHVDEMASWLNGK